MGDASEDDGGSDVTLVGDERAVYSSSADGNVEVSDEEEGEEEERGSSRCCS